MAEDLKSLHRIAREDLASAVALGKLDTEGHARTICVLCQQAAELYLKAALMTQRIAPSKTHDLPSLVRSLGDLDQGWLELLTDAQELSTLLVLRYEGDADEEDAFEALMMARHVAERAEAWIAASP